MPEPTAHPVRIESIQQMLFFINAIRETDRYIGEIYLKGGCYQFHQLLRKLAPDCEAKISKGKDHIVTYFKGQCFDITGLVDGEFDGLTPAEIQMASAWSFAKSMALCLCECPACGEPIVV